MSEDPKPVSFFPSSYAIVNGGTFAGIINNNHTHIQSGGKSGYERLLDAVATHALHNSGHIFDPPKCHPGTRVAVMGMIMDWKSGVSKDADIRQKYIAWLSGGAGAGKSAIGRSICEQCEEEGTLLANFFFGSSDPTRNHAKSLAATISYQICGLSPGIRRAVSDFIDYDPLIFSRSLKTQFVSLVMNPLSAVFAKIPQSAPRLIVIDGLDECLDKASQRDVLETLIYVVSNSSIPIRFLICSRPNSHITNTFSSAKMNASVFRIFLSDEYSPSEDIKLYLNDRFRNIKEGHIFKTLLPPIWPRAEHVDQLVEKSSGQFIYASTVVRYVESPQHQPHQRLNAILGLRAPFKDLPFAELDAVYKHVLGMSEDPSLAISILAFPALYNRMASADIETVLGLESGDAQVALSDLASLVNLSTSQIGIPMVSLLHKSFADFLFDSSRSDNFFVSSRETLARNVLRVIQLFSEKHVGCRFEYQLYTAPVWTLLTHQDIDSHLWTSSNQDAFTNAVAEFPIEAFTKELFSHKKIYCAEGSFFLQFFQFMLKLTEHKTIRDIYRCHINLFCQTVLSVLRQNYANHHEMNFIFTFTHIVKGDFRANPLLRPNCLTSTLHELAFQGSKKLRITRTFRHLINNAERVRIVSLAAAFCLETLCELSHIQENYQKPLNISWINKTRRKTRPWQWHRQHPYCNLRATKTRFTRTLDVSRGSDHFLNYARIRGWNRNSAVHLPYADARTAIWTDDGFKYATVMRYLIKILPLAGGYAPLIQLCKTRSFSTLSIWTPVLSRRARRSIAEYLERMEGE